VSGLNPWLAKALEQDPPDLTILVEVEPGAAGEVKRQIGSRGGRTIGESRNFVQVRAPDTAIQGIADIDGVKLVHYDAPVTAVTEHAVGITLPDEGGPIVMEDPLVGAVTLSDVLIPASAELRAQSFRSAFTNPVPRDIPPEQVWSTGSIREWLDIPEDGFLRNVKVAVADSGLTQPHPLLGPTLGPVPVVITALSPLPFDVMGHGEWTSTALFGTPWNTPYGLCQGMVSIPAPNLLHIKALADNGEGTVFSIIRAMDVAERWGADVLVMSLSGPLQGSVFQDPMSTTVIDLADKMTVIAAAGNLGPSAWTVQSPAASPDAIAVGAWAINRDRISDFSARGPQNEWYRARPDLLVHDGYRAAREGMPEDAMFKPDVLVPGGNVTDPEMIYSGTTGWLDGEIDGLRNGFEPLKGTSMSAPIFAGMFAKSLNDGMFTSGRDFKRRMNKSVGKRFYDGDGYGPRWSCRPTSPAGVPAPGKWCRRPGFATPP